MDTKTIYEITLGAIGFIAGATVTRNYYKSKINKIKNSLWYLNQFFEAYPDVDFTSRNETNKRLKQLDEILVGEENLTGYVQQRISELPNRQGDKK